MGVPYQNPPSTDLTLGSSTDFTDHAEWMAGAVTASQIGALIHHRVAAGSGDAVSVKGSAGQVYGWEIFNLGTVPIYVKLFNKATAPTLGSDTPVLTIAVQAGLSNSRPVGTAGLNFGTGVAFGIVTGIADNNSTGVTASTVVLDLFYK